jgi:nucleoside-diphosphate-sugar epimerase
VKVLVTGSSGLVGRYAVAALEQRGHEVAPFDLVAGNDVLDPVAVEAAALEIDAVVHLAVIGHTRDATPAEMMATNVDGTRNVLAAAARRGARQFVYASSVNALGVFLGLRAPDYLPIDDDHPCYSTSTYGISKLLGEELCAATTRTTGMSTICLRIPNVIEPDGYSTARAAESERGIWEYGYFIDARDLGTAISCAVDAMTDEHERVLLGSSDAMRTCTPPIEIADRRYPGVRWTDRDEFAADPSLPLVRADRARELLGWSPVHTWAENVAPARPRGRRPLRARVMGKVRAIRPRRR